MNRRVIDLRKRKPGLQARSVQEKEGPRRTSGRRSPLRARRRKLQALSLIAAIVGIGALGWGAGALSYADGLALEGASVAGAREVSPHVIRAYVETQMFDGSRPFISQRNIFLYSKRKLSDAIVGYFPRIKSVSIKRDSLLAQAIRVTVEERALYALWCRGGEECYLMDDGGFIFANATNTPDSVLRFNGALPDPAHAPIGQTFLKGELGIMRDIIERLKAAGLSAVLVSLWEEGDFALSLSSGLELRSSLTSDPSLIVRNLQLLLSQSPLRGKEGLIEYIDLRFGSRVYYKFSGGKEQSVSGER